MEKAYNAQQFEDRLYSEWKESGYFNPDNLPGDRSEPYAIMMPPPNVTGILHLGHALENTIMDVQVRYQRMQGKKAMIVPGTDHAAVATQAKVEAMLVKEGMEDPRAELGRDGLLERIRDFAEDSKETILGQVSKMGTSADWSRLAYTFDDERSRIVNDVFVRMFNDGLIYRGNRLINWSTGAQSVLSDDELEYDDITEPFYYIRVGEFIIGTVRPETKCADSPLVIHPTEKYARVLFTDSNGEQEHFIVIKSLIEDEERRSTVFNLLDAEGTWEIVEEYTGAELEGREFEYDTYAAKRQFRILADEVIDPEKGAGAMTISSSHSEDDYDLAKRRDLPETFIEKIDMKGFMTDVAGPCSGMSIEDARKESGRLMKEMGLLVGIDEGYFHRVPLCYRTKCVVEPMISKQWFIDVNKEIPGRNGKTLKHLMRDAVTTGLDNDESKKVVVTPERFEKVYMHWIENLHDWCISRQIWWGHRIPVWYSGDEIVASAEQPEGEGWTQDEDSLDTWFSSGMWTFSTLGGPGTEDFNTFHPTAWMQMGHEILFLWMARMILFSSYYLEDIPFNDVYIHGILRDKHGEKFSKSKGNGIDPLDVISEYGTDALRLSLIKGIAPGADSRFYYEKVEDARNFVNKLWNVSRFAMMQEEQGSDMGDGSSMADQWILSRLQTVIEDVTKYLDEYQFSHAAELLYSFTWSEFADWYIEMSKVDGVGSSTKAVLHALLKMLHPIAPFITEAVAEHSGLREELGDFVMVAEWPKSDMSLKNEAAEKRIDTLKDAIVNIRGMRSEYRIDPARFVDAVATGFTEEEKGLMEKLARVKCIDDAGEYKVSATIAVGADSIIIPLDGVIDVEAEQKRIQAEIDNITGYLKGVEAKLSNEKFLAGAPEQVIEQTKQSKEEKEKELEQLHAALEALQ